ncbi:MAG: TSUP family transporter, partial [Planctomycetota bacterium]
MFDWQLYLPIAGVEINGFILILLGFTAGVLGGFFGVGGAFIITPALNIFGFPMAYAIGTDMAHIFGSSIVATARHRKLGNVDIKLGIFMVIFTVIGVEIGATLIMYLERIGKIGPIVRYVYILLLSCIGSFMFYEYCKVMRGKISEHAEGKGTAFSEKIQGIKIPPMIAFPISGIKEISLWAVGLVAMATGILAGFLGVGGGFIRMPALLYVIGSPTRVAVGTDLFEIIFSAGYGAFTYALKSRVELFAAVIMFVGAAVGAQFGTLATKYVKGLKIRLYFAFTIMLAALSVVFKHISARYNEIYESALKGWISTTTGLTDKAAIKDWVLMNKAAIKNWVAQQADIIQSAYAAERFWNNCSGYLMLGTATIMSLLIISMMVRGILREREEAKRIRILPVVERKRMIIASTCGLSDTAAIRVGGSIAKGLADEVTLFVCKEPELCEDCINQGKNILAQYGVIPEVEIGHGKPYGEILRKSSGAYLLVIGSRPISPFEAEYYLGDNATKVIRNMNTTTLVVKGRESIKKILLCLDIPYSLRAVNMAKEIALTANASIEILHVASLPTMYAIETAGSEALLTWGQGISSDIYQRELKSLISVKEEINMAGVKDVSIKILTGMIEEQIIEESVKGDFDLIILKESYMKGPLGVVFGRLSSN